MPRDPFPREIMSDSRTHRDFGLLLRNHRRRAGLTQRHLADLATVSVRAIRNLELGKVSSPRPETVRLLADGLGLRTTERDALIEAALAARFATTGMGDDDGFTTPWNTPNFLVGREAELCSLTRLLHMPGRRLVSVVGVPGVGKSRLAAEAARFQPTVGAVTVRWLSRGDTALLDDLAQDPSAPRVLLVLDDADLSRPGLGRIASLLQHPLRPQILLTAPGPCGIPGEQVLPLSPLAVPDRAMDRLPERLAEVASVRLLCAQIHCHQPAFGLDGSNSAIVAELCRRLDGLPRALEFAGDWCLVRSPEQLLAEVSRDPFSLTAPPTAGSHPPDPASRLRQTLDRLPRPAGSLLATTARSRTSWSIAEAARAAGTSDAEAAAIVFTLVTYGLVRTEHHDGTEPRFSVLHQVRHLHGPSLPATGQRHLSRKLHPLVVHRSHADNRGRAVAVGDA
ncbi:helix-turn-helix domain-containing protein [Streptomyces sp. NPDC001222]|uniref:helix-turn-helix domain-containing protein n=1 Tax=Streptomyces sp. NPDC001222 TaxID=3364548 RepID=UPI00368FAC54